MSIERMGDRLVAEIAVAATLEQAWAAISDAFHLANWFPTDAKITPGAGGRIEYKWGDSEFAGASEILTWQPENLLVTREPRQGIAGATVDLITEYQVAETHGGCRVRVVQSGFGGDDDWRDYVDAFRRGWAFELRGLRYYLERHFGERRQVVWARKRLTASPQAAWAGVAATLGLASDQQASEGSPISRGTWDGAALAGTIHIHAPPRDFCATLTSPAEAFLRVKIDGWGCPPGELDAHLWLSLYEEPQARVSELQTSAQAMLDSLAFG